MPLLTDDQSGSTPTVPFFIGGKVQPTEGHPTIPVISALTGETVHHASSADTAVANKACDAAAEAFASWRHASYSKRRDLLYRTADIFEQRRAHLVQLQRAETSCEDSWAQMNVSTAATTLRELGACVSSVAGSIPPLDKPDTLGFVFKEPIGVVLTIPPWNAALVLATRAIAAAVGAGCAVVLKASELCPRSHFAIVEAFVDAGLPAGVINCLQVRREDAVKVTEELIRHEAVRKIEFIGSASVGRAIAAVAGRHLKPVMMELGSKTPSIVLDDADLRQAAKLSATGALMHQGQICFSTERIIVQRSVAEEFQGHLIEAVRQHKTDGAFVSKGIASHACDVLKDAEGHGHEFLTGGPHYTTEANLEPAIVLEPRDSRIVDEETFGPSMSLYVVENDEEAVRLANRTSYGLNAAIHSKNMERALRMSRLLEFGQVHINSLTLYTSPTAPQKGVKGSGWGSQNGKWALDEFLVDKFVSFHGQGADS